MATIYHYTHKKNVYPICDNGMVRGGYLYTTDVFNDAKKACSMLGIPHSSAPYLVALKFKEDSAQFRSWGLVEKVEKRGFEGGAIQFEHELRLKPIAVRIIIDDNHIMHWENIVYPLTKSFKLKWKALSDKKNSPDSDIPPLTIINL